MDASPLVIIIAIVFLTFFVFNILYFIFSLIAGRLRDFRDRFVLSYSGKFDNTIRQKYEPYFLGKFSYYDKLPDQLKTKFLLRVRKFIRYKTFEARDYIEVTEEMKAMIAAAAVQLTFGLEEFVLDHFSRIIIYPDSYLSPITGLKHMGEANPNGILVISWKDFQRGFSIPDDTFNVGLHEMSHALELSKRLGGAYDVYFSTYYEKWKRITEDEFQNLQDDGESFLRDYAGTNRHEFFAVCIEHFFEASEEFKSKLPEIYNHLCILLNQDPLSNDTIVKPAVRKSYQQMFDEVSSSEILYSTDYSVMRLTLLPAFILLFNMILIMGYKIFISGIVIGSIIAIVLYFIALIFLGKKVVLFDKYIGIMNMRGKLKYLYPFEDIVSVTFPRQERGNSIRVLMVRDGKVFKNEHSYLPVSGESDGLRERLEEKEVIVY